LESRIKYPAGVYLSEFLRKKKKISIGLQQGRGTNNNLNFYILICTFKAYNSKSVAMIKKIFSLLVIMFLFSACEGPTGPPGPPGDDGAVLVANAFEIEVDFNAGNGYRILEDYGFEVFPFDVTLVYILWEQDNGTDIWRLLPQIQEFPEGQLQYNYDFTQTDVSIFLDGTINFNILGSEWTQDQVFRVVVIPADNVGQVNINNLEEVMKAGRIVEFENK
jgi:hypothetical protein